jgi:predicted amidohydrolase
MKRRQFIQAAATVTAAQASGITFATGSNEVQAATRPRFKAAVIRIPVLVPQSASALEPIRRRNSEAMVAALEKVMREVTPKPRIVVFPVLQYTSARRAVSGVPMSMVAVDLVSEPLDRGIFAPVVEACRRHDCYVATSTQEKVPQKEGWYFHTGFIMGPEGLVLRSPKVQAQSAPSVTYLRDIEAEYKALFGADSIMPVAETPIGNLACFVEGEAEVLEASRLLSSKGADVILHTSLEENNGIPWQALKQSIGFQCHVFLLTGATSRMVYADERGNDWCGGASTIVGPDGQVLASIGGRDEGYAAAEIDLAAIDAAKKKFGRNTVPAWHLYKELYRRG